jgi:hypothetical protein
MTTIRFDEVSRTGVKAVPCESCGKKLRRQTTFTNTISPFNVNADGRPRTRSEIWDHLGEMVADWKRLPAWHEACTGFPPEGRPVTIRVTAAHIESSAKRSWAGSPVELALADTFPGARNISAASGDGVLTWGGKDFFFTLPAAVPSSGPFEFGVELEEVAGD